MQIVSIGDNLHVMSNPVSWKNKKNILECLLKFLPKVLRFKATFNSVYKCEKASWLKGLASKK